VNKAREYLSPLIEELVNETTPGELERIDTEMKAMAFKDNNKQVMNIQNLTQEEIKNLHTLLGKMLEEPQIEKEPLEIMIDKIMDEFNFSNVLTTMEALDWKWASSENKIPSIESLRKTAERLLRGAAESRLGDYFDSYWELGVINATGGFQATAFCDKMKTRITALDLKFIVEEWDSEI